MAFYCSLCTTFLRYVGSRSKVNEIPSQTDHWRQLTFEELSTFQNKIGALCPQADDSLALAPGHFLIGRKIISPTYPVSAEINTISQAYVD